jgi:quercetin dioxygenase-like cupin family protein
MDSKQVLTQPEQARQLHAFGQTMAVLLAGEHTSSSICVLDCHTPPGLGPPPHTHRYEDEIALVQSGTLNFLDNGGWTSVHAGGAVFLPRGQLHTYRNDGDQPSRHWVIATPSGFERFFARCADEFDAPGGPDIERIVGIAAEHGIEIQSPRPPV